MRNLTVWMTEHNRSHPDDPILNDLFTCSGMDASVLYKWLCCLLQEMRKENGDGYPPTTLHQLLAVFQRILRDNKILYNIFDKTDLHFQDLHNTLACICKKLRKSGVGEEVLLLPS